MPDRSDNPAFDDDWVLEGGGEAAGLIRRVDWAATPIGPMAGWPRSLKTTVATMLHSRHPMFLWWGPELVQIYNDAYTPSFGVGKHPAAMGQRGRECWPEIWDIIGPQIDEVLHRGRPTWHEDALVPIFRNGGVEDAYWTYGYSPVFGDDGAIAGVLVVCSETTARVTAMRREQALRSDVERDRQRLHAFFAQAPAGICILRGPALTFEFANEHYQTLVGGRPLVGRSLLDALPELRGQGLDVLLRDVMASEKPFVGRELSLRVDRQARGVPEEVFYTFIYSPLREATAGVNAVIMLAIDVTEEVVARRRTAQLQHQLIQSEAQFHLLVETIPQLAWAARPDGYVDWFNQRWYDYTGTTREQVEGWGWTRLYDPDLVEGEVARWQASLLSGDPFEMEATVLGADRVPRWHLTRAVPLRDAAGQIVRWFGTCTDIDVSRRAAQERARLLDNEQRARRTAESASRAKDDFLSTASHELRTPLSAILGWARLLQSGQLDAEASVRAIDSIERNARTQVRLVEDILDGSRIITGRLHLETRPLDMVAVAHAALDAVRAGADAKAILLTSNLEPDAAPVVGDPDRLQQVIWNLANNAIKFTPKHGSVHVSLRRQATDIELEVTDSGEGIEPEFLPHVFDRFRQAQGNTTRRHGGLGLGLALVRHLVEAHGGTVRARSDGPGRGAVFTVTLPAQAVRDRLRPAGESRHDGARPLMPRGANLVGVDLLVVDDEADARDVIATALRTGGATVTVASSAEAAIELLASNAFMALVSDIGMPGMDGFELIRQIRASAPEGPHLPAIALTAYSREEDRRRTLIAGFDAHVPKPVEPDYLVDVVASLVGDTTRAGHADVLAAFDRILETSGVHDALRLLNSRTEHRFTGVYRFDPPTLRNLALVDAAHPVTGVGDDMPMEATYCSIVGVFERSFVTEDALQDERLVDHPARGNVRSYCGVLLRGPDGVGLGTLCHFDLVARQVPATEVAMMQAAGALIARALAVQP